MQTVRVIFTHLCLTVWLSFFFAMASDISAQTYSSSPATGTFKNVGNGYRFRVSSISGGNVTFEILPKTGTFGQSGTAVIKKNSAAGTVVGTGSTYNAGASTAGTITVNMSTAGLSSGSMDFYAVKQSDTTIWDGPIVITKVNARPQIQSPSASSSAGTVTGTFSAYDADGDTMNAKATVTTLGESALIPEYDVPGVNFTNSNRSITLTSSNLASAGLIHGQQYKMRFRLFDSSHSSGSTAGEAFATFTYSSANTTPSISITSVPVQLGDGRIRVNFNATDAEGDSMTCNVALRKSDESTFVTNSDVSKGSIASGANTLYFTTAELADMSGLVAGSYRVRVRVYDAAHNNSSTAGEAFSSFFTYTIANAAPTITSTNTPTQLGDGRIQVVFNASDPDGDSMTCNIALRKNDGTTFVTNSDIAKGSISSGSNTLFFTTAELAGMSGLVTGSYQVRVRVFDAMHNTSATAVDAFTNFFTYTAPAPTGIQITNVTSDKSAAMPGESLTWTYTIENNTAASRTVLLAADLYASDPYSWDQTTAIQTALVRSTPLASVNLPANSTANYTVTGTIPSSMLALPGAYYQMRVAVWEDLVSPGYINPGQDALLAGPINSPGSGAQIAIGKTAVLNSLSLDTNTSNWTWRRGQKIFLKANITASYDIPAGMVAISLKQSGAAVEPSPLIRLGSLVQPLTAGTRDYSLVVYVKGDAAPGSYSLRVGLWNDSNNSLTVESAESSGTDWPYYWIGDLAPTVTLLAEPVATVTTVTPITPTQLYPNLPVTWTYGVTAVAHADVLLGASLASSPSSSIGLLRPGGILPTSLVPGTSEGLEVTGTVDPATPVGDYAIRVGLWQDINQNNQIDPTTDISITGTFQNFPAASYPHHVNDAPVVTVTSVSLGAFTSVPAGSKIDLVYTIQSSAPTSVLTSAGLAYTSHPNTSPFIGLPPAALISCPLEANVPKSFTMQAIIPSDTVPGTYYIRSGLWFDRNNNGTIDSGATAPAGDLPVVEAKTWPTAATTITVTAPVKPTLSIVTGQTDEITESGSSGSFTIKRVISNGSMSISSAVTAKVRIDTSDPTSATPSTSAAGFVPASADYILTRASDNTVIGTTANVVIPANQDSVTLNVLPHDDTTAEGAELIRVVLDADSGYVTANTSAQITIRETIVQTGALAASTVLWSGKKTGGAFIFPTTVTTTPGAGNVPQPIRRIFLQTTAVPGFPSQRFAQAHLDGSQATVDLTDLQWRTADGVGQPLFLWSQLGVTAGGNYQLQFSAEIAPAAGATINAPLVYQLSAPFTLTYQNSFTGTVTPSTTAPLFKSGETVGFTASSTGGTGSVTYQWYGSKVPAGITSSSLSFPLNYFGLTPVIARHADTADNVWWSQSFVSLARTSHLGDATSDSSRRLAIQGVDTASGNLFLPFPDLSVPAIGVPFSLVRFYNSDANTGDPEKGWSWNYTHAALSIDGFISQGQNGRTVTVDLGDRTRQEFVLDSDGNYVSHTPGNFSKLFEVVTSTSDYVPGTFLLIEKNGLIYEFGFPNGDPRTPLTHYFAKRHLLSIKNHRGQGLTFAYEPVPGTAEQRRLDFIQDATGRFYRFGYDASQRLNAVADFTNRGVIYQYPDSTTLRPDRFTDVRGKTTRYIYHTAGTSSAGRLHSIIQPENNTPVAEITYYTSVANRRVAGIRDGRNNLTAFEYLTNATNVFMPDRDEDFRVEFSPTTKAITSLIESYGKPGQFTRTTDFKDAAAYRQTATAGLAEGSTQTVPGLLNAQGGAQPTQSTSVAYDDYGTATSITDSLGFSSQTTPVTNPDKNLSLPQTVTDRRNKPWSYNWNTTTGELNSSTSPEGDSVSYTYWDNGLPKTVTDGETHTTQFFYTLHGYPDYIIDAAGKTIDFQADALGRVTKVTDQMSRSISYTHNAAGQVESVTLDGLPIAAGESKTASMTYDDNGRLETRTDRRGAITEFRYNAVNLTSEVILPASTAAPGRRNILLDYDSMNRPSTLENLNGHTSSRTYDTRGRLHTIINGLNQTVLTRTYYDNNLVKTETDGAGITTEYIWDANNRLVRRTSLGNLADASDDVSVEYPLYDNEGQPLTIRDPRGNFTHFKYDNAGRKTQSVAVKQGLNTNRDTALADPGNFHQRFTFDRNSQMKTFTDPEGHTTTFFYDAMKRLDLYTDAANRTWDYDYYDNGLPHTVKTPDNRTTTYTFDAANRLDRIQYHEVQVFADFGYDANGNQTSLQDQHGTTTSAFDSRNQITSTTDTFGQTVGYDYFPGGNLKYLTYPGNHVVAYTWDAAERMKTVSPWTGGTWTYTYRQNSQLDLVTHNNSTLTDYGYDSLGRLNDLWHKTAGGTLIARQQFSQFDKVGNPEVESYTTAPGFPTIPSPPAITAATYDPANRLQTVNGTAASVDGGGRTLATPAPAAGTFTWEGPDWLKTFTQGTTTQSYKVSGTGERIERSVSAPSAQTTRYTLDRSGSMANVLAETDAANSPRRYYIHGLGLLASIDATNGSVSTYHFDHRGDTLALTNATQAVTDAYAYSVFGTHAATGSTANPFRFAGQVGIQTDSPDLLHMRARYYQPMMGRFISQDPSGFADGMNVFGYVNGSATTHYDANGRNSIHTTQIVDAAGQSCASSDAKFVSIFVQSGSNVEEIMGRFLLNKVGRKTPLDTGHAFLCIGDANDLRADCWGFYPTKKDFFGDVGTFVHNNKIYSPSGVEHIFDARKDERFHPASVNKSFATCPSTIDTITAARDFDISSVLSGHATAPKYNLLTGSQCVEQAGDHLRSGGLQVPLGNIPRSVANALKPHQIGIMGGEATIRNTLSSEQFNMTEEYNLNAAGIKLGADVFR